MRVASITLFFSTLLAGCSTAHFTPGDTPDAAGCAPIVEYPCKLLPPDTGVAHGGCDSNPTASNRLEKEIPSDAGYPYACTVIIPNPVPDDDGNCIFDGTCRCDEQNDGGLGWTCALHH